MNEKDVEYIVDDVEFRGRCIVIDVKIPRSNTELGPLYCAKDLLYNAIPSELVSGIHYVVGTLRRMASVRNVVADRPSARRRSGPRRTRRTGTF